MKDSDVVILAAIRSPIGKFGGSLKDWLASDIAAPLMQQVLLGAGVDANASLYGPHGLLIMGHVLSAGEGQHPVRQAARKGGLPYSWRTFGISRVCSSSLQALWEAYLHARDGNQLIIAGGMESMSNSPLLISRSVQTEDGSLVSGPVEVIDSMLWDGLLDACGESRQHMGEIADKIAHEHGVSREMLDDYAFESYRRAYKARGLGPKRLGISPSAYPIDYDEGIREPNLAGLKSLKPIFGGSTTVGNASQRSDGAAVLLVTTHRVADTIQAKPVARIVAFGDYSDKSVRYPIAPSRAAENALIKADKKWKDMDLVEVNEAFAGVPLSFLADVGTGRDGISQEKLNIWGGAIAIGHPLGASGARIVVTLVHALKHTGGRYGLAVTCNGGGEAVAVIIENLQR